MIKSLSDHESSCINIIPISLETLVYEKIANGDLYNSSGKMEWKIIRDYGGKVEIIRNYTDNSFLNSTTTSIEQFNKTTLKISVIYT